MTETMPPVPPAARKGWWGRNWKWFVPTGCFTLIVVVLGFVVLIVGFVMGLMKSSGAYTEALAAARENPAVTATLGTPIQPSWYVTGNIDLSGSSGHANLAIPILGPKGRGTLHVVAVKSEGEWEFRVLKLAVKGADERIDLLAED